MQESAQLELAYFKLTTCFRTDHLQQVKATAARRAPRRAADPRRTVPLGSAQPPAGGARAGPGRAQRSPGGRLLPLSLFLFVRRTWWVDGFVLRLVSPAGTRCFLARGCIGLEGTRVALGPLGGTGVARASPALQRPGERGGRAGPRQAVGARGGTAGPGKGLLRPTFQVILGELVLFLSVIARFGSQPFPGEGFSQAKQ